MLMQKAASTEFASTYYAATLMYTDAEDVATVEEPFLKELLGDVLSDLVQERGLVRKPDEVYVVIEDALTVSSKEGSHARVFLVQALHPVIRATG
jgi:hypothetical protein